MEIILTHEQADFDAAAAMLAVYLLNSGRLPVLPNRMNRNLRKFINLYGSELPFVEPPDLPHEPIQSITLVDTQSLVTLKGTTKNTKIHVIDHHQQKTDFPEDWSMDIEKVGATTTLLVERFYSIDLQPGMVHATLLLLGIYEDTGSLTYASTTVRDVKAVAYLLEKGASLRIAAEYLNPALSTDQRLLADRLIENAQTLTIHGKKILLARADASEMNEEISSVAHKLRDLLDPDALFLMVRTKEGLRIIARSTSDEINVSKIMNRFGGGGHERAASALLSGSEDCDESYINNISQKLTTEIKASIQPSLTVKKIMSKKPLLLSPDTTIDEADRVMLRYGYEGYPVAKDGKVVGLLTRRAIDRARQHKLHLKVASLMESGNFSLLPNQSIEQVQDLMASTGWGQLPVIDPVTEEIVGIVTRTDLLKNLISGDKSKPKPKPVNYGELIDHALSPCRLALLRKIIEISKMEPQGLYIVGGFVRDLILQRPSQDFDIVAEGDAIHLAKNVASQLGGRVVVHRRFKTAKWQVKDVRADLVKALSCKEEELNELPEALDFISARTEFYDYPTALPVVESSSIKQDLHRRDFTINTLALRLDGSHYGELQDHWGGLSDLQKKQVKVLHSLSFVDDPTRLLRAVRFEQRFGFEIETRTLQLMIEARENLKQVSGDRIRHELDLIFKESEPCKVLSRLAELDLLSAIHPDLEWKDSWAGSIKKVLLEKIEKNWKLVSPTDSLTVRTAEAYLVWFLNFGESALSIGERLHFSNGMLEAILVDHKLLGIQDELREMTISKFTDTLGGISDFALYAVYCLCNDPILKERMLKYIGSWRDLEPMTTGEDLKSMGIPPGPRYAAILKELRSAWLDGIIKNKKQEDDLLEKLVSSY